MSISFDIFKSRLIGLALPVAKRNVVSHLLELLITIAVVRCLTAVELSVYAVLLGIVAFADCANFNIIDKKFFKLEHRVKQTFNQIFIFKVKANLILYSGFIILFWFFGSHFAGDYKTSFISNFDLLVMLMVTSFFINTAHPFSTLGPKYKIFLPYYMRNILPKSILLILFTICIIFDNANLKFLVICQLCGATILFVLNTGYMFTPYRKSKDRSLKNHDGLFHFWFKNIPNNVLNAFDQKGIFVLYGLFMTSAQLSAIFILYRLVSSLLAFKSIIKQVALFYFARYSTSIQNMEIKFVLKLVVAAGSALLLFQLIAFVLLNLFNAPPALKENHSLLIALFCSVFLFYANSIMRPIFIVHRKILLLTAGSFMKMTLLCVTFLGLVWLLNMDPIVASIYSLILSMVVFTVYNFATIRRLKI